MKSVVKDVYELTHPQKRILVTQLLYEEKPLFNIGGYVIFKGNIDFERMVWALSKSVQEMDCFSIRLCRTIEGYFQYYSDDKENIDIWILDKEKCDEKIIHSKAQNILYTPFDLLDSPLYKIVAFKSSDNKFAGYILCCHHIIFDGWSANIFAESVSGFYNNTNIDFGKYEDYIQKESEYLMSKRGKRDKDYWEDFLEKKAFNSLKSGDTHSCNGYREEYRISSYIKEMLVKAGEKWHGINTVLSGCFILADYLNRNNGVIAISNYNRHGRVMRKTAGMFTNTLLIGVNCAPELTLAELLLSTRQEMNNAISHFQWPYDLLGVKKDEQRFQYNINSYNTSLNYSLGDIEGRYVEVYSGAQDIPFQLVLNTWEDEWLICLDMREDYYHSGDGQAIMKYIEDFLVALEEDSEQTIKTFEMKIREREKNRQKQTFMAEPLHNVSLSQRLERILCAKKGDMKSVICEECFITYEELGRLIYGAMECYRNEGICRGDKIIIYLPNCLQYIVYVLAAAIKGICFTPLDIEMPIGQVNYIYEDTEAKAIVTKKNYLNGKMNLFYPHIVRGEAVEVEPVSEDEIAYLLYTSGSTGMPKGVLISRKSLGTYLDWAEKVYGQATFFLYSSPAFDLSLTSLFLPLTTNGRVVVSNEKSGNLYGLVKHKRESDVDAIKATPTGLSLLLQQNTENLKLRMIICGGEELSTNLAYQLQMRFGDECKIYNEYGPTECTIGCMCYLYSKGSDKGKTVSIGNAAPGCHVYVVDSDERLCSVGKAGEIYLSGKQLAYGYWKRPEENSKYFLEKVLEEERIYKTGDIGRYCLNGTVEYLGRIGKQCKINGYRVELDSVERVIKSMTGVRNAAVWVKHSEYDRLYAAVETTVYNKKEIVEYVEEQLPLYCVPHHIFICSALPVTKNGKLDIRLLEQGEENGEKREIIEKILREVLNYQGDMNHFDYLLAGGDSIRALRIIAMLEEYGYQLSLIDLLDHPCFDELISYVREKEIKTISKEKYQLPIHLQYFALSCPNFRKYRHTLILRYNRFIDKKEAVSLNDKLRHAFPSLNCSLEQNIIYHKEKGNTVKWAFLDKIEIEKIIQLKHEDEKTDLFNLTIITNGRESWIYYDIHHVLVDGISWKNILFVSQDILNGQKIYKHALMEIYKLDDVIRMNFETFMCSNTKLYSCCKKKIKTNRNLKTLDFIEAVKDGVLSNLQWQDLVLLCDWNGRDFIDLAETNNIGCFSVILPIKTNISVEDQIRNYIVHKKLDLTDTLGIRVNFMGDIRSMVPSDMILLPESIEYSLEKCSAYGCVAEITGMVNEGEVELFFSWRSDEITQEEAIRCLERVSNTILKSEHTILVELTKEEEESLYSL